MSDLLDDYDFTPSSSSNLRSLFDNSPDNSNSNLSYTAPKQPKILANTEQKTEPIKVKTSVIYATVVQVWKLIDGKYIAIGKHGCAIIGSSTQSTYEIILYKEIHNVIMRSKICPSFEFCLKKDDFASFYDSAKCNWLIKFNNNDNCMAMVNYIEKYEGSVKSNENSISTTEKSEDVKAVEELNPDNKVKADILTRIAKMGQSILPNKNVETEEVFHTIDTSDSHVTKTKEHPSTSLVATTNVMHSIPSNFVVTQPISYDPFNVYVAENRAHGSEVRMNLSQISEKLNCIMKLVESPKVNHESDDAVLKSKIKVLELRTENVLKELSSFQEENVKLKLQLKGQQNVCINEEFFKAELQQLQEKLQESEFQIIALTDEKAKITETHNSEINQIKRDLELAQDQTKWTIKIQLLKKELSNLQAKLTACEEQQQNRAQPVTEYDKEKNGQFTSMLKEEMNAMYAAIGSNINGEQMDASELNSVIAQNIKFTTLKIIQNFQQLYEYQETSN